MEKTLLSSNLYSHPDRLLEEHLIGVANLSELFCRDELYTEHGIFGSVCRTIALSHDLGKATCFFQNYLKASERDKKKLVNQPETHHGLFSAVCAYFLVRELLTKKETGFDYYPLFSFVTVKRHHGDLHDLMDEVIFDDKDSNLVIKQLENIEEAGFAILSERLCRAGLPILLTRKTISEWVHEFSGDLRAYKRIFRKLPGTLENYMYLNMMYSILLDADKSDVVVRKDAVFERDTDSISCDLVDVYKSRAKFQSSPINVLRESAYTEVLNKEFDIDKKLYAINLPTGLGKTLISFSFALKLRGLVKNNTNGKFTPRIIYALPFLSIIEQNADIFKCVLKFNNIEPYSKILIKHHHLSEIFYQLNKDEEFEGDAAKIMIEGWNSEIIVTTFIQLFHTIVSNKNRCLRKFHRLSNSIIILDEVQSIPIKYWVLLREILQLLAKSLNTYVVFVTATEPLIFERKDMINLVEGEKYFREMDRVTVKPMLDRDVTLGDLYGDFKINKDKRYLFIFNTISAANKFYELTKIEHEDISFLSTHIIPKERLIRIQDIKEGKYKVVITTQLVEAGVDIDFDVVVRDLAPLDSINQSAGRCNRNKQAKQKGEVYIFSIKDENGRRYSSYIYDPVLLEITRRLLVKEEEIVEKRFLELIDSYYVETSTKKTQEGSRKILEAIERLRYDAEDQGTVSVSDFKLIEEDYLREDVFVEIDSDARNIWNRYEELGSIEDIFKRKNEFDVIKSEFYQYVISVPARTDNLPPELFGIRYISQEQLNDYYDFETGFNKGTSLSIW